MRKIIDYMVVREYNLDGFTDTVNKLIKNEWQPIGGGFVSEYYYYQSMVKYGDEEKTRVESMQEYEEAPNQPNCALTSVGIHDYEMITPDLVRCSLCGHEP